MSLDICIIRNHRRNTVKAMKWSEYIAHPRFANVGENAKRVYEVMLHSGQVCPEVEYQDSIVQLTFRLAPTNYVLWTVSENLITYFLLIDDWNATRQIDERTVSLEQEASTICSLMHYQEKLCG